jgi:hypothetical protein
VDPGEEIKSKQGKRIEEGKSLGLVGLGREQELNAEITDERRLIAASRFEAASSHEQKDHRAMDSVTSSKVDRGLVLGRMECALRIEFHVHLQFWGEIVADDEAGEPAVRSFVDKLITDLVIHIDGAKFPGEFEGQKEGFARRGDPTANRIVGVVEEELRENRDGEARLPGIVEAPLDTRIGLTEAILAPGRGILDAQPGILISELNAIANAEIDIDIGSVGDRLTAVVKGHVAEIDFPIEMAGSARIIGVIGWAALGE